MTIEVRIDKWMWAARFFKTRSLAQTQIEKGRVKVNEDTVKPARLVRVGDKIQFEAGDIPKTVVVMGLSDVRGSAPVAQRLYEETPDSIANRVQLADRRKLFTEPAAVIKGRPTKRDRRDLERAKDGGD
jgi:ribosome-associated heat shock protein Hsp15